MNDLALMVAAMKESARASNAAMHARDKSCLVEESGSIRHAAKSMFQARAKIACSGCDRLLPHDWPDRITSGIFWSPPCREKLRRWAKF